MTEREREREGRAMAAAKREKRDAPTKRGWKKPNHMEWGEGTQDLFIFYFLRKGCARSWSAEA